MEMTRAKPMGLNIKAVSERTGVALHTLRAWERRYGIPRPDRNRDNRYRLYDEQDIADVIWMKRQVDAGVSPAQASALLKQQVREPIQSSSGPSAQPIAVMQSDLYNAFAQRDENAAHRILNAAWSTFAPEQVVLEIIQPTMNAMGDAWQRNLLSVEQEHFASNLVRQRLYAMIQAQPDVSLSASRLVAACAPEEQHDLGLLIFTLLAKRQGWSVEYLGQRTPLAELARAGQGARFIVLSVSTVTGLASLVPVWNGPLPAAPILFGGKVFAQIPVLRSHVPGAFLSADGVHAIRELVTSQPQVSDWSPPPLLLSAALALDAARLQIASTTVQEFESERQAFALPPSNDFHHELTHAALFLTDAVVSALAFDAPEIMDLQGVWITKFMPAHKVPMPALHSFLRLYNVTCERYVSKASVSLIRALVMRLVTAVEPTANQGPEGSQV